MGLVEPAGIARLGTGKLMSIPVPILFTIPNFITAGSGGAMLNIIRRLDRGRFSPAVAVLKKGGRLEEEIEKLGIPLIEAGFTIPPKPYATLLARAYAAGRFFRPCKFALWHSFHYSDDYTEALVAALSGASWIYTKKNMNWNHRSWILRTILAKHVLAQNSDMLKSFFSSRMFSRKVTLVPRGVDTQKFKPTDHGEALLRQQHGIPTTALVVSCVAQLVPVKDHPSLLNAFAQLPGAHLLLAGSTNDDAYLAQLKQTAGDLGLSQRMTFLGNVTDIPSLLAETDIFVLSTKGSGRMEGCPVALLEAMACGKPCVATDIPGARDIIVNEVSGLLVPPEDAESLANAIRRLADSPSLRQQLGEQARRRVEEHFTIEHEVAAHQRLYSDLLGLPL